MGDEELRTEWENMLAHQLPMADWISDTGKMRIVLDYWIGESERTCDNPPHRKTAISKVFVVRGGEIVGEICFRCLSVNFAKA